MWVPWKQDRIFYFYQGATQSRHVISSTHLSVRPSVRSSILKCYCNEQKDQPAGIIRDLGWISSHPSAFPSFLTQQPYTWLLGLPASPLRSLQWSATQLYAPSHVQMCWALFLTLSQYIIVNTAREPHWIDVFTDHSIVAKFLSWVAMLQW